MSFWKVLGAALAAYAVLNFIALPRITNAWKDSRSLVKNAKIGLLAAVQFARDAAFMASLIYIAFALVTLILSFGFGHSVRWLGWVVSSASTLHGVLRSLKEYWETWFFLLPLTIVIYLSWSKQRRDFANKFNRLVEDDLDRLNREREESPEGWAQLQPDERMQALDEQIRTAREQLATLAPSGPIDRRDRQKLLKLISLLTEQKSAADYERRVRLEPLNAILEGTNGQSASRHFFLSQGFFSDLTGFSKLLSRVTFALLSVALIGVASDAGLAQTIQNRIIHLDDLRVDATKEEVAKQWQAAVTRVPADQLTSSDRLAINLLADNFARALLQNPNWRPATETLRVSAELQQELARRAVLSEVRLPKVEGTNPAAFADGFSPAEREVLHDVISGGAGDTRVGQIVSAREGPQIKSWLGSKWETTKASILEHAKEYRQPVRLKNLEAALLDRVISSAFDSMPDLPGGEIGKNASEMMSEGAKEAVKEAVTTAFRGTVEDLAAGKPYKETIAKVRTTKIPLSKSRTEELAALIHDTHLPDPRNLQEHLASSPGGWNPPTPPSSGPGGSPAPASRPNAGFETASARSSAAERNAIIREIAQRVTRNGQDSLPEEAIDALAQYEDHFPRSIASQAATPLGRALAEYRVAGDASRFAQIAELKVVRSGSFAMLRGFSRVGGVLIGTNPENPEDRLDILDIGWRIDKRDVWIVLQDSRGRHHEFGPFDKSLVHQALAYAADGRPVAGTMTVARPLPFLKIHVHPSLVDTPLGCRIIEVDRLVDTYAGTQLPQREQITATYEEQLAVYDVAWAVRANVLADAMNSGSWLKQQADAVIEKFSTAATAGLKQPHLFDRKSVLLRKAEFFDLSLVEAAKSCQQHNLSGFEDCLRAEFTSARALKNRDQNALNRWVDSFASFQAWSGVRERTFRITPDLAFLRAPAEGSIDSTLWPFDFIVQLAFTSSAINLPERQQDQYVDQHPVEFDELKPQIHHLVAAAVEPNGLRHLLNDLRAFTILQRMFRAALKGHLGDRFPLEKLPILTTATSGGIPYSYTPRWNGSYTLIFQSLLRRASAVTPSESWMVAAGKLGRRCETLLAATGAGVLSASAANSCDFSSFSDPIDRLCTGTQGANTPACIWKRVATMANDFPELRRREVAFGVLEDQLQTNDHGQCPPLDPAVRWPKRPQRTTVR